MPQDRNLRVLVVDDQESMRLLTRACLRRLDIESVVEARTGQEAIGELEKQKFDLVISDWIMPDMDGLQLLTYVREQPTLKATPFIMTSARQLDDEISIALRAGADKYLVKPFKAEALGGCIDALVGPRV